MCRTCGCESAADDHEHSHGPGRLAPAPAVSLPSRAVRLEVDLLEKNDRLAGENRAFLQRRAVLALNVMGTPGAGKTALLEATLARLCDEVAVTVLEGDQETDRDAERIRSTGVPVLQINTGAGCHLDASMVRRALLEMEPPVGSLLIIENVGNLVCPALFDLGERAKVVVMSTTEGEDKPLKYPHMFRAASVVVLNKVDLLPHLSFDVEACLQNARRVNPKLRVFQTSATRGDGLDAWCAWLSMELEAGVVSA